MKKIIILIIFWLVSMLVAGYMFYNSGLKNGEMISKNTSNDSAVVNMEDSISRIDYPLIDIAFNDGNDWLVLIENGMYGRVKESYFASDDKEVLQFNKEFLKVETFPAGRGTTPNGSISVYKNGEMIKCVEYFALNYENEDIENAFKKVSGKEAQDLID